VTLNQYFLASSDPLRVNVYKKTQQESLREGSEQNSSATATISWLEIKGFLTAHYCDARPVGLCL
jgi:hypothetical protein